MAAPPQPMSHHDILALAEPFRAAGRRVDLAASERRQGRLRFAPLALPQGLRETLCLHCEAGGRCRLVRTTAAGNGLQAVLELAGGSPAELLGRLDAVPPAAQFHLADDHAACISHRIDGAAPPRATRAELRTPALVLSLETPRGRARSARLSLQARGRAIAALPDDLLAVLGAAWSPLKRSADGWRGSVRVAGGSLVARVLEAGPHLVRTLAEPPEAFDARHRARRWAVAARRAVPFALWTALGALAVAAPALHALRDTPWPPLLVGLPPLALLWHTLATEAPFFEWPQVPQALPAGAW